VLLVGPGDWPELDEFPAVYGLLLHHLPHRFVDVSEGAVFPAETAVILLDNRDETGIGRLYEAAASQQQPSRCGRVKGFKRNGSARWCRAHPDVAFDEIYLLANWVIFLGYSGPETAD
jgi:hypothetical protein